MRLRKWNDFDSTLLGARLPFLLTLIKRLVLHQLRLMEYVGRTVTVRTLQTHSLIFQYVWDSLQFYFMKLALSVWRRKTLVKERRSEVSNQQPAPGTPSAPGVSALLSSHRCLQQRQPWGSSGSQQKTTLKIYLNIQNRWQLDFQLFT